MFSPWLVVLALTVCIAVGPDTRPILVQFPKVVKVAEGEAVQFQCSLERSSRNNTVENYTVHWYHPENKTHILLSHFAGGSVYRSRGFSERFQLSRNVTSNSYILTIRDLKLTDTNTYICGIWGNIFGKGTRLNVTGANAPNLLQSLIPERVTEGHTAQLQCTMRNAAVTRTDVHWYRERPENNTEWVLTHNVRNITQWSPGFTERFQSSRDPSNNSFILTITNVWPSDTGVYYCKVWGDISGNGTQLTVMVPAVGMNRELWIVWISVGAALGVTLIAGAALLFCIRITRSGKRSSSSPHHTGEHSLMLEYENISAFRNTKKPDDLQVDGNQIYTNVPSK
ncbi:uncharacterized protein LOC109915806 isoform X2 [Rhincodon typus]|uniref:uncharacterized protein LOC109915806 isoform X2 n=1 Tax=Rhincodon typus TaxID=259920 RepID=UPI00202E1F8C|nr:uncharacterized protein LOC109915806 isoform X2 [Rhincodon typus]